MGERGGGCKRGKCEVKEKEEEEGEGVRLAVLLVVAEEGEGHRDGGRVGGVSQREGTIG